MGLRPNPSNPVNRKVRGHGCRRITIPGYDKPKQYQCRNGAEQGNPLGCLGDKEFNSATMTVPNQCVRMVVADADSLLHDCIEKCSSLESSGDEQFNPHRILRWIHSRMRRFRNIIESGNPIKNYFLNLNETLTFVR